jgi:hypothetical protein
VLTTLIGGVFVVAAVQTIYTTLVGATPRKILAVTLPSWVGAAATAQPITCAGLSRSEYLVGWFTQTLGQGVSVGVILTVALIGIVRTVRFLLTGEAREDALIEPPTGSQLAAVFGITAVALVTSFTLGSALSAGFTLLSLVVLRAGTRRADGFLTASGLAIASLVLDPLVTQSLGWFVVVAVVTVVATSLLPPRPVHHAAFTVGMGSMVGIAVSVRTASLSTVPSAIPLVPTALFGGMALLLSTIAAGLFNGPEIVSHLQQRKTRSLSNPNRDG